MFDHILQREPSEDIRNTTTLVAGDRRQRSLANLSLESSPDFLAPTSDYQNIQVNG